jgi:hypothetical protein
MGAVTEEVDNKTVEVAEPKESVETPGVEESPDIAKILGEEEKPELDGIAKALIRKKAEVKDVKKEKSALEQKVAELEARLTAKEDHTVDELDDQESLTKFIKQKAEEHITGSVTKELAQAEQLKQQRDYDAFYEAKLAKNNEIAIPALEKYVKDKPELAKQISSSTFQSTLSSIQPEILARMSSHKYFPQILEYYANQPTQFQELAANSISGITKFGEIIGKLNNFSRPKSAEIIKPIKGGDNTTELDPDKDYAKFVKEDGSHDTERWRRAKYGT